MRKAANRIRCVLDAAQRRFDRSRPGSVLILVIALLVLLALIGTAYMTMAQGDRAAAQQHTFNTEVDLLMEGVENMVKGTVVGELFANGQYRPANGYNSWNALGLDTQTINSRNWGPTATLPGVQPGDPWLAPRVPEPLDPRTVNIPSQIVPAWRYITAPVNGGTLFDSPYRPATALQPVQFSFRDTLLPTHTGDARLRAVFPIGTIDGQDWPAFIPTKNVNGNIILDTADAFMAADADGDGIPDSAYVKLLTLDGITYYAAVRIVDNLAAVNASVATTPNTISTPVPSGTTGLYTLPGDFFPTSINMQAMTWQPQDSAGWSQLLRYRNGGNFNSTPINDAGRPRRDFSFSNFLEANWEMMGRRLANPVSPYAALPVGETMEMARNFCLAPPTANTLLEQLLPGITGMISGSTSPYLPSQVSTWFSVNFDYGSEFPNGPKLLPKRALLVSRNPVTNFIPSKFRVRAVDTTGKPIDGLGGFQFGDFALFQINKNATPGTPADMRPFVCIDPTQSVLPTFPLPQYSPPYPTEFGGWVFEPWKDAPTKASVNTSSFGQLWLAYWSMMVEPSVNGQPPQPMFPSTKVKLAAGRMFRNPVRPATPSTGGGGGAVPTTYLTSGQVAQLRAALAAVNTMQLRQSNDDVVSRTITLTAPGASPYRAQVYGVAKQPYITDVYARNDGKSPQQNWVAIELHNPYPTDMKLVNWHVATLQRKNNPGSAMPLNDVVAIPTVTIPKGGYIVLTNNSTPPNSVTVGQNASKRFVQITDLYKVFGMEFVLMRPRRADGILSSSLAPNNTYAESRIDDMVPVDSYDFSNLSSGANGNAKFIPQEWHYIRPSTGQSKSWHFVYPGRWTPMAPAPGGGGGGAGAADPPTVEPTDPEPLPRPMATPLQELGMGFNSAVPSKVAIYKDVPLQINNVDFGGPNKVPQTDTNTQNRFPFGEFARNGDVLQVTFIGSYKITSFADIHTVYELNPVTMDSCMAVSRGDGSDVNADPSEAIFANKFQPYISTTNATATAENIGRFCPIDPQDTGQLINDYFPAPLTQTNGVTPVPTQWRYHWATRLFDYLTVQSPQDDYLPDVDPGFRDYIDPRTGRPYTTPQPMNWAQHPYQYYPARANGAFVPDPAANKIVSKFNAYLTNTSTEETSPIDGLININTAPWRVLAAVPFLPTTGAPQTFSPAAIAQSIVYYRDVNDGKNQRPHGPFLSLFELNDVPIYANPSQFGTPTSFYFRNLLGNVDNSAFGPQSGDYAPIAPNAVTPKPVGDFQARFLMINRVSNFLTTRSDSFTAYILVQGWRDAETNNPHLVVQRRTTLLIDRSPVTPVNKSADVTRVPSD